MTSFQKNRLANPKKKAISGTNSQRETILIIFAGKGYSLTYYDRIVEKRSIKFNSLSASGHIDVRPSQLEILAEVDLPHQWIIGEFLRRTCLE